MFAAVFLLAGSSIWCEKFGGGGGCNPYVMTLDCTGAILAAIGGVFLIVVAAGGGGGSTSPA